MREKKGTGGGRDRKGGKGWEEMRERDSECVCVCMLGETEKNLELSFMSPGGALCALVCVLSQVLTAEVVLGRLEV